MRRKIAIAVLSVMVLAGATLVCRAQEAATPVPDPGQAQPWGGGPPRFVEGGQFGGPWGMGRPGWGRMGWQCSGRHGFGGGEGLLRMADNPRVREYLGLTDEQVSRLHAMGVNARKASVQSRADMELRHIELGELLRADNPNHDAIMQKLDEVNALRGKMEKERVETMLSARAVLTPDQVKKMKTFMENRGFGMGRGPGMQRRGGPGGWGPGRPGGAMRGQTPQPTPPPAQ